MPLRWALKKWKPALEGRASLHQCRSFSTATTMQQCLWLFQNLVSRSVWTTTQRAWLLVPVADTVWELLPNLLYFSLSKGCGEFHGCRFRMHLCWFYSQTPPEKVGTGVSNSAEMNILPTFIWVNGLTVDMLRANESIHWNSVNTAQHPLSWKTSYNSSFG